MTNGSRTIPAILLTCQSLCSQCSKGLILAGRVRGGRWASVLPRPGMVSSLPCEGLQWESEVGAVCRAPSADNGQQFAAADRNGTRAVAVTLCRRGKWERVGTKENLREMFGSVGKRFSEAARKTEGIAGDVWQHLKTGPSITDAAMGRIAQVSKVISEGGYDKIFQQTFECLPDEKLKKAYACYLSTSHGPIMGVLYVSTAKLAFCSDSPVAYVTEDNKTESAIYKIVVPVPHLRSVTPTASQQNPAERYIQVVSVDNHDFWFMGFVNYDSAVKCLQDAARGGA
ncbi:hypothetical protein TRIUR3_15676 [Triticum urartu]|uniref:Uncharacterized protein n=1 Tax=Triticum urartu TaxID=4572 RepID=M7Y6W0_TRIUA|nr:hypothetical protein TRIUR3_15676 [Triticum urartu]